LPESINISLLEKVLREDDQKSDPHKITSIKASIGSSDFIGGFFTFPLQSNANPTVAGDAETQSYDPL